MTRGEPPQKSSLPIRVAECFLPLHTCIGVALVLKIETGLECRQWLLRKMIITVTGAKLLHVHSVSQSSRQPLTPFESHFIFADRVDPPKLQTDSTCLRTNATPLITCNGRKHFATRIGDSYFEWP
jgi:hypothetical protein